MANKKQLLTVVALSISALFLIGGALFFKINFIAHKKNDTLSKEAARETVKGVDSNTLTIPQTLSLSEPVFPDRVCNIMDFGAIGDGQTMNTDAFREAIAECSRLGGGKIVVPKGEWLTGPIVLQNNIWLFLEQDSEILFSAQKNDYLPVVRSRFEGVEYYNYSPPLSARNAKNIAITGKGTLNGQAEKSWWTSVDDPRVAASMMELYTMGQNGTPINDRVFGGEKGLRPAFIEFFECQTVLIEGVTFVNGPMWTIHPLYSDTLTIRDVSIRTHDGRNTDGIVVDSSQNVVIEGSKFSTGDDAIAIKSGRDNDGMRVGRPSKNILIKNCAVEEAHAAIAIGSEVSGGIQDVFVDTMHVKEADFGIRMKSSPGRGASVHTIRIQNMNIESARIAAIELDQMTGEAVSVGTDLTDFSDIRIANIRCDWTRKPFLLNGAAENPPYDIELNNLSLSASGTALLKNVQQILLKDITFASSRKGKEAGLEVIDSKDIVIDQINLPKERILCAKGCTYR